jgi:hypothetical protein
MTTCLIDLCGEKGLEGFTLLRPLFYPLTASGKFRHVTAAGTESAVEKFRRIQDEGPVRRVIFFIDSEKGAGLPAKSLCLRLSELKEKILSALPAETGPENCIAVVLDSVEREGYSGRPVKREEESYWELDFSGWLNEPVEDLPFVFTGKDFESLKTAWGQKFDVSPGQIQNVRKDELSPSDRRRLAEKTEAVRHCADVLKHEKEVAIRAYSETRTPVSCLDSVRTMTDMVFAGFEAALSHKDQTHIEDGYGNREFSPDSLLRKAVQETWSIRSLNDSMSVIYFSLPGETREYHRRMVELGLLTLALAEGRFGESLRNCGKRVFHAEIAVEPDAFGEKTADYIGRLDAEAGKLRTELSTGRLSGPVSLFQVSEIPAVKGLAPFKPLRFRPGLFKRTGDYARFVHWSETVLDGYGRHEDEALGQLNACMDIIHQGLAQKPVPVVYDNLEEEREKRMREFEGKREQPMLEHARIPDNRSVLSALMEESRGRFQLFSAARPTSRPMLLSLTLAMGVFALGYVPGAAMTGSNDPSFRIAAVPLVLAAACAFCALYLLGKYRRTLMGIAGKLRKRAVAAAGKAGEALFRSHGILEKRYELNLSRRNFEITDRVFRDKAKQRELLRHHRDNLENHRDIAAKWLDALELKGKGTAGTGNAGGQGGGLDDAAEPDFKNRAYWPMGDLPSAMRCYVDEHALPGENGRESLCSVVLRTLDWQPH